MKVALIINHNSAADSLAKILKDMGHLIYIPIQCDIELFAVHGQTAKNLRTIHDEKLDSINFYRNINDNDQNISLFINQINTNYDILIMIPHIYSSHTISRICSEITKKIIFLIWGNIRGHDPVTWFPIVEYDKKYSHVYYGFTVGTIYDIFPYDQLKHKIITPLTLNSLIYSYVDTWKFNKNYTGMTIISRMEQEFNKKSYNTATHLINKYNINLTFYGKNDQTLNLNFQYPCKFGCDIENIYQDMVKFDYFIYILNEPNLVQYSALEAIYIGLPVFYLKTTLLGKLINKNNYFECATYDEIGIKIQNLKNLDNNEIMKNKEIQKLALKHFDEQYAIAKWNDICAK